MKEIGGYIELDTYRGQMLHEGAIALNSGRNALAWLLHARGIRKLWIPRLICDSVPGVLEREGVPYAFYDVGFDFLPSEEVTLGEGEWFYLVNYYSQMGDDVIAGYLEKYGRVIVDQAQSYFQMPVGGADTLYTCRKYFGVPDGAFLYTDAKWEEELPQDESFERMRFLLGRYERTASEFYPAYVENNRLFRDEPVKRMSKLTQNLLHGIDYENVKAVREQNFLHLHEALRTVNRLSLSAVPGTFMYPFCAEEGGRIRKQLQEKKIYIPTLWPSVLKTAGPESAAYRMAENILPLPIDQRYTTEDMDTILEELFKWLKR
uniref:Conserved domain protein n=1 Tax=uncultured bacterium Contig248 TaxID=1393544 RepID=W0FNF3_9BACT|nr:conserved domain protein [uncultured bacterium Contig248]